MRETSPGGESTWKRNSQSEAALEERRQNETTPELDNIRKRLYQNERPPEGNTTGRRRHQNVLIYFFRACEDIAVSAKYTPEL